MINIFGSLLIFAILQSFNKQVFSKLKGASSFIRTNPRSDIISANKFHHLEFYTNDATTLYKRFMIGLGMKLIAKSDQSTGNQNFASYVLRSKDMIMSFTAPYLTENTTSPELLPFPTYCKNIGKEFVIKHGVGVRCISIHVDDVTTSFQNMINNGGEPRVYPTTVTDQYRQGIALYAEIHLYGDVHLRLIESKQYKGSFFPNYQEVPPSQRSLPFQISPLLNALSFTTKTKTKSNSNTAITESNNTMSAPSTSIETSTTTMENNNRANNDDANDTTYGFVRYDHVVGNLWSLEPTMSRMKKMTGFHEFAEFVAEDVGTVDSGLNSVVLANNNEFILLPLNEPTFGTKRKSQIQTYLEQNNGEGVQHIAMFTGNIFRTLSLMRASSDWGGFEFMDSPGPQYYQNLRNRLQSLLTDEQYALVERYGILVDQDEEEGILLQIFTKPISDRSTLFLEVIQRVGCIQLNGEQKAGCGGFGKGNFKDLFKSIEDYEKKLGV